MRHPAAEQTVQAPTAGMLVSIVNFQMGIYG